MAESAARKAAKRRTLGADINQESESHETWKPGVKRLPRIPGPQRDFGKLPVELRTEKGSRPNLMRAEKENPPGGAFGKDGELFKAEPIEPAANRAIKRMKAKNKKT